MTTIISCVYCHMVPTLEDKPLVWCANCDAALCEDCRSVAVSQAGADDGGYFCLIPQKTIECHQRVEIHRRNYEAATAAH